MIIASYLFSPYSSFTTFHANSVKYEECTLSCTRQSRDGSFYFLSFSSSCCLGSGAPLQADFRGCWTSIRGRGPFVMSFCGLKILCCQRNKPTRQIQLGTLSGFSTAASVSEGRGWLGFLLTVALPADCSPGKIHQRCPRVWWWGDSALQRANRHPEEGDWRGREEPGEVILWLPAAGGLPADPEEGTSWTGIITSSRMKATGGFGVGRAHGHRATYLFHVFPCASSRL